MSEPMAAADDCEHYYETRLLGGHPITVRACILCRQPDWKDLAEQAATLYRWGREEALAGKPLREHLSAYDMPREGAADEATACTHSFPDPHPAPLDQPGDCRYCGTSYQAAKRDHDGPSVAECAEADERWWGGEKTGE